jgi:hypothetical protein
LLCLYCHDNEHQRYQVTDASGEVPAGREQDQPSGPLPISRTCSSAKHSRPLVCHISHTLFSSCSSRRPVMSHRPVAPGSCHMLYAIISL